MSDDFSSLCIHCVSTNVTHLTCYYLDLHDPLKIIFSRSIAEKARNHTMLCFPTSPRLVLQHYLAKEETQKRAHYALCVQNSQPAAALSTSFVLNHGPNSPDMSALITRLWGVIHQREYESWAKKVEEIQQRLAELWQCTMPNKTYSIWVKNALSMFPRFAR